MGIEAMAKSKQNGERCFGILSDIRSKFDPYTLNYILDDIIVGGAGPVSSYAMLWEWEELCM